MNDPHTPRRVRYAGLAALAFSLLPASVSAGPYVGAGAAATVGSGHPSVSVGYRTPGKLWRGELGIYFLDRDRGKTTATGALGPTISAERFDLKTRLHYAEFSHALRRRESGEPSGLELGLGLGLVRVAKQTRVELRSGGEIYSNDVVWKTIPLFRIAYVRPVHERVDLGFDMRYLMTSDEHGGKGVGGWNFALSARWRFLGD
jgi:hypothetical protein